MANTSATDLLGMTGNIGGMRRLISHHICIVGKMLSLRWCLIMVPIVRYRSIPIVQRLYYRPTTKNTTISTAIALGKFVKIAHTSRFPSHPISCMDFMRCVRVIRWTVQSIHGDGSKFILTTSVGKNQKNWVAALVVAICTAKVGI